MSGLATFLEPYREKFLGRDPLKELMDASFKGEKRDESFLSFLANHCENLPLCSPEDLVEYHRALLSLLFFRKSRGEGGRKIESMIRSLILKGRIKGFGKRFCLQKGYEVLETFLFENKKEVLDIKQLERGAILHDCLPHPFYSGELGLIFLYLGLVSGDDKLVHQGLKCVEFVLSLCDHRGELFQGCWQTEADYRAHYPKETFALLFHIAFQLTQSSQLQFVSNASSKHLSSDLFIQLFNHAFKEISFPTFQQKLTPPFVDRSLGFFRYQYRETSLIASAAGRNTGFAALHKKGIQIVSMGPHYSSLADPDHYGIARFSNGNQEGFKDLKISSSEGHFQGWTRIGAPNRESGTQNWLFFNLEAEDEKIDLTIRKSHHHEDFPLFYVFYVSADKGIVGEERELSSGVLDRYQGGVQKALFKKGKDTLEINPYFEGEMTLIPLSGKVHFWSADFLLAFSFNKKLVPYRWTIQ